MRPGGQHDPGSPTEPPFTKPLDQDGEHALVREFRVEVIEGVDRGSRFRSTRERALIGTHASADLVLRDPAISRFHLELALDGGRVLLRDLDSKNGTAVDGVHVQAAYLGGDAVISIGQSRLRFELGEEGVKIPLSNRERFGGLVGSSRAMRACFALLEGAARSDATVLLQGETGCGKDAAAEAIHRESGRAGGPFVVVDCGAIPGHLLEDYLFGHERGAFTGASSTRGGAFEAAHGGTLFLDEIGELPLALQPVLLRAVESRKVRRVGGNQSIPVDVRIIAATNRDLRSEVNAHRFRSDLYFRLAVVSIALPALRDRLDDLPQLVASLLADLGLAGRPAARAMLEPAAITSLRGHPWRGNIRELRNYLERRVGLDLPAPPEIEVAGGNEPPTLDCALPIKVARDQHVRWFERRYLARLLDAHNGNVTAAARTAGVDRIHLHRLLSRAGLR